jgi:hypothetical protein
LRDWQPARTVQGKAARGAAAEKAKGLAMNILAAVKDDLSRIAEMQEELLGLGWQFLEHVFNDGEKKNCLLLVCKSDNPTSFNQPWASSKVLAFGRLPRLEAWWKAMEAVREVERNS